MFVVFVKLAQLCLVVLLLLRSLLMLLCQLSSKRSDLGLQHGKLLFVLLFHSHHAGLKIPHELPNIDRLVPHSVTHAAHAATVT